MQWTKISPWIRRYQTSLLITFCYLRVITSTTAMVVLISTNTISMFKLVWGCPWSLIIVIIHIMFVYIFIIWLQYALRRGLQKVSIFLSDCNYSSIARARWWTSYQLRKIVECACAGNAGNVFPATDFKGNRFLAIPACITARASRTCRDACRDRYSALARKTFPAFPAHAQPTSLHIWQEAHGFTNHSKWKKFLVYTSIIRFIVSSTFRTEQFWTILCLLRFFTLMEKYCSTPTFRNFRNTQNEQPALG